MIPSKKECFGILKRFNVPDNIIAHSVKVKELSVGIAEKLAGKGEKINMKLLIAGALLHDISKMDCIKADVDRSHGDHGYERLLGLGLSEEVANISKKHMLDSILTSRLVTWEEKIIFYADKRVTHDRVVSLGERFAYLRKRYPQAVDKINKAYPKVVELEKEIFKKIGISPEELISELISGR